MANDAIIVATGNLTADPKLQKTISGQTVLSFDMGVQTTMKKEDGSGYESNFYRVSIFGKSGEYLMEKLQKGTQVEVVGALTMQKYVNKNGQQGSSLNILAWNVSPRQRMKAKDDPLPYLT